MMPAVETARHGNFQNNRFVLPYIFSISLMILQVVGIYTVLHFLVDLACAVLLYHQAYPFLQSSTDIFYAFLLYNFFAFAVQLPIGIIADSVQKNALFALTGCLLVCLAYLCSPLGILACVIAGLGNACFHIGAGIDVLKLSKGKATFPGIFVSSGAFGIFLGAQHFFNLPTYPIVLMLSLGIGGFLSFYLYKKFHHKLKSIICQPPLSTFQIFMIVCLCLTVLLRSYTGFIFVFDWKNTFVTSLIFVTCIVFGKAFGGILGDKFGLKRTAVISLLLSAVCFIEAFQNNVFGIVFGTLGVLFFNMTMPITLTALTNLIPSQKGMAFGLLTFMLFLGGIPTLIGIQFPYFNPWGITILIALSGIILYGGLLNQKR